MKEAFFAIRDGSRRKARPCAFMRWTAGGGFQIDIQERVSADAVPAYFVPFVERGELSMGPEDSAKWVSDRVPPSGRQNLGEILDAHSLNEYSELELLRSGRGESSQDSFVVQEIDAESYERRGVDKASARRKALGKAIKERRLNLEMSQRELADELGISQPALSKIESGAANITFDLLAEIDECLSVDEPSFLRIPESNLWTRERSEMRRGFGVVNPDHAAAYEILVNLLEEVAGKDQLDASEKQELALVYEHYAQSLRQIAEGFECAEVDGVELLEFCSDALAEGELKELCGDVLAKGVTVSSLRNYLAHHWDESSWNECLAIMLQSEAFQKEFLESFSDENRELLMLLAVANRVNAEGEHEKPSQEQVMRLVDLADSPQLSSLVMRELKNLYWRDEFERYEYAVVGLEE